MYKIPNKSNSQIVAHCFFLRETGKVEYINFDRHADNSPKQ